MRDLRTTAGANDDTMLAYVRDIPDAILFTVHDDTDEPIDSTYALVPRPDHDITIEPTDDNNPLVVLYADPATDAFFSVESFAAVLPSL
jgi:hypothetical protein